LLAVFFLLALLSQQKLTFFAIPLGNFHGKISRPERSVVRHSALACSDFSLARTKATSGPSSVYGLFSLPVVAEASRERIWLFVNIHENNSEVRRFFGPYPVEIAACWRAQGLLTPLDER
jgi:hypothetical protein